MSQKLKPVIVTTLGGIVSVHFDLTIMIDKSKEAYVIDNSQVDWKDFIDGDTLVVKQVKIEVL